MSLKENIDFLKDEITTEEKFFEGFFKLEKIWKKYKIVIIGIVVVGFVGFIGTNITQYIQLQNKIKANKSFNALLNNPQDTKAKETLKGLNPELLTIATYLTSGKTKVVNIEFLDKLTKFNSAISNNDLDALNKIGLDSKFLLKEYALFQKALAQTISKKYTDAKETLSLIPENSAVSKLSNKLKHYLLTK